MSTNAPTPPGPSPSTAPPSAPALEASALLEALQEGMKPQVGRAQAAATMAAAVSARLKPARDEEDALKRTWGLFLIFDQALEAHLRGERVSFTSDPSGMGVD